MHTINSSDILVATVAQQGMHILTLRMVGVNSIQTVYEKVRRMVSKACGIFTVSLRNITQGWTVQQNLVKRGAMSIRMAASTVGIDSTPVQSTTTHFGTESVSRQLQFQF